MTIRVAPEAAARGRLTWAETAVVNGLGLYTLVIYGITYYAIGAAAPAMAKDFGTTTSAIFALMACALIGTAAVAPRMGMLVDRVGAGPVLFWGAAVRAFALIGLAAAPDLWTFAVALIVVQACSIATEYEAAFAAAVQAHGSEARSSVSLITLWGGFASTAFWPLTAAAMAQTSWRTMFGAYAVAMLMVCVPVAAGVMRQAAARTRRDAGQAPSRPEQPAPAGGAASGDAARSLYLPLLLAFCFASIVTAMPVILPPMLEALGLGASAVLAGMLFGPAQTAARFLDFAFSKRFSPLAVAVFGTALLPVALAILIGGGTNLATAVAFSILFGAGNGLAYVVRGTVVLAVFDAREYATWLGRISRVRLVVSAAVPFLLALVMEQFGATAALSICLASGTIATMFFALVWQRHGQIAREREADAVRS